MSARQTFVGSETPTTFAGTLSTANQTGFFTLFRDFIVLQ